jgi:hypothetical protein
MMRASASFEFTRGNQQDLDTRHINQKQFMAGLRSIHPAIVLMVDEDVLI